MRPRLAILLTLSCAAALAQTAPSPTFDVASIKPAAPQGNGRMMTMMRGGPGTPDPSQITWTNASLMNVLTNAWDVNNYQITGPAWLDTERFDITAKIPPGATKEQFHLMLQNLLAERFHMAVHHETKEFQGYELVAGKNGSKLKPSSLEDVALTDQPPSAAPPGPPGPPRRDANGFAQLDRPGLIMMVQMGPKGAAAHMTARAQAPSQIINMLGNELKRPVVDKTGLTGKYDFTLEYAPDMSAMGGLPPPPPGAQGPPDGGPDDSAPNMLTAVQEQLGLKLDPKKIQLDMVIIDRADKVPTEN